MARSGECDRRDAFSRAWRTRDFVRAVMMATCENDDDDDDDESPERTQVERPRNLKAERFCGSSFWVPLSCSSWEFLN